MTIGQIEAYIRMNSGSLSSRQMAADTGWSQWQVNKFIREEMFGFPPYEDEPEKPAYKRPPAKYSNLQHADRLNEILNMTVKLLAADAKKKLGIKSTY